MITLVYELTFLEMWIADLYAQLRLYKPADISEAIIAQRLGIELFYVAGPAMSFMTDHYKAISLNQKLPAAERREQFFHELCHLLRHAGKQTAMPASFRHLQEQQATLFQISASIPIHFLQSLPLSLNQTDNVSLLAAEFGVTPRLAAARLDQIKRRSRKLASAQADAALRCSSREVLLTFSEKC